MTSAQVCKLLADVAEGLGSAQGVAGPSNPPAGNANQAKQVQTPEQRQAALKARLVKKFSAKSAVYENCKMLSQDGELLCFCDLRKLTWYEVGISDILVQLPELPMLVWNVFEKEKCQLLFTLCG